MLTGFRLACLCTIVLALVGCAGNPDARPSWSQSPDIDVAGYQTFGWLDATGKPPVTILDNQIRNAVRERLIQKGYVESADDPDFLVRHETLEQETVSQSNPVRIGIGVGTRAGNVGTSVGASVPVGEGNRVQRQIRVAINAIDSEDRREAWTGTTSAVVERPEADAVARAVAGVMKGFPDRMPRDSKQ